MTTTIIPSLTDIADALEQMADHIARVGLHKGALYDEDAADGGTPLGDCPTCTVGAACHVIYGQPRYTVDQPTAEQTTLLYAVVDLLQDRLGEDAISWSDGHDQEHVVDYLRATVVELRAGVAS
ncbi:hypothetical protein [Streptomyces sp. CBMA152]|uniref:DUF6197 family protein n=1 Tax=Streptomyces sp. CBMA152 TaxID=1896312 RepID=UPI0016602CAA|nr:hypothetical protein [Streptomyces sp. CBMA152]MBD0743498.1 hypothetical protein [Streptomyces sp. CBMA152]